MKEDLKRSWRKVPVYCAAVGWISFQAEVRIGSKIAIALNPDGTVENDAVRWMLLRGAILLVALLVGAVLFRKMTRRELFCSASVMVVLNVLAILMCQFLKGVPLSFLYRFYSEANAWSDFLPGTILQCAAPYLFVLFAIEKRNRPQSSRSLKSVSFLCIIPAFSAVPATPVPSSPRRVLRPCRPRRRISDRWASAAETPPGRIAHRQEPPQR